MKNLAFPLLKSWCDKMTELQVRNIPEKGIYGGILCPACSLMHGRSFDSVYPMLYMAKQTGDKKYVDYAEAIIKWSEHMSCPDGSWINDTGAAWKGITTFGAIALSEALIHYPGVLSAETEKFLSERLTAAYDYLCYKFDTFGTNINYLASTAYTLLLGYKRTGNESYAARAEYLIEILFFHITENNLLCGEGKPWDATSEKGCKHIDIGYNVEETLCLAVLYASLAENKAMLDKLYPIVYSHMQFMLPDGGFDNSFGSRSDKWTYYGSRTSDGCFPALLLLRDFNPDFENAAYMNLKLLSEFTSNGLLMGGRDLARVGEPSCVHHTFTHAKAVTFLLEFYEKNTPAKLSGNLPYKSIDGFKYYSELDTYLYVRNGWRATFTAYDGGLKEDCHPTGGAISYLWNDACGILLCASMTRYKRFEIVNTQRHLSDTDNPLTVRLEYPDKSAFSNILDSRAKMKTKSDGISAIGHITDYNGKYPSNEKIAYSVSYDFEPDCFSVKVTHTGENLDFYFPVIAYENDQLIYVSDGKYIIKRSGREIHIESVVPFDEGVEKIFNHVPGFEAYNFKMSTAPKNINLKISVR